MRNFKEKYTPTALNYDLLYHRFRKKLLNTACSVFTWENLPETFNEQFLNMVLIENGRIGIIKHQGQLYTVLGNVGGEVDMYYRPKRFLYANPVLGSGEPLIGKDVAVLFLTSEDTNPLTDNYGLSMLLDTTATLLADNQLSLNVCQKNSRLMLVASSDNEATRNSTENVLKAMYDGEPYKAIMKRLQDDLTIEPLVSVKPAESMRQLIENYQFIWSTFLQELGINSNFNLKRERLLSAEVALNSECMDTLIDDIEKNVNNGVDMCNEIFGTNIQFSVRRYGEEHALAGYLNREDIEQGDIEVATSQPDEPEEKEPKEKEPEEKEEKKKEKDGDDDE